MSPVRGEAQIQYTAPQATRQGNLIVESSKAVPFEELRRQLIEECRKQGKPYGLLFEDISGGFTTTSRRGPQSFKVLPIVVYRVYADGQPDAWAKDEQGKVISVTDIDGDGKSDVIYRNTVTGENLVHLLDRTMFRSTLPLMWVSDQNWRLSGAADFNNDGKLDVGIGYELRQ